MMCTDPWMSRVPEVRGDSHGDRRKVVVSQLFHPNI